MEATMESDSDEKASSSEPGEPISDSMRKSLPGDVLLIVLRKLPLQSLRRFRCVCREWNDLCMSWESSISLCLKPGKLVPLYMGHGALSLSDTSTRCWVPCHLEFGEDEEYELVASGGGLLVFLVKPPLDDYCQMEFPTFIVSNPWTRQFLRLPTSFASGSRSLAIPEVGHMWCGIDVDLKTRSYTFLFLDPPCSENGGKLTSTTPNSDHGESVENCPTQATCRWK